MNTSTPNPPPDEVPNALDILTEIALLKDSEQQADLRRSEALFVQLLTGYEPLLRGMAQRLLPFNKATCHFDTDDLYSRLTEKIWNNADKFNPVASSPKDIQRQFVGWTSKILKNIVHTMLASLQLERESIEYIDEAEYKELAVEVPEASERAKILGEVLKDMDPDDAEIIRWSGMSKPLDGSQLRTDPEEREIICRQLGVTPASLRKRRQRAFNNLREEFKARTAQIS